jgi:hypothetical protein
VNVCVLERKNGGQLRMGKVIKNGSIFISMILAVITAGALNCHDREDGTRNSNIRLILPAVVGRACIRTERLCSASLRLTVPLECDLRI